VDSGQRATDSEPVKLTERQAQVLECLRALGKLTTGNLMIYTGLPNGPVGYSLEKLVLNGFARKIKEGGLIFAEPTAAGMAAEYEIASLCRGPKEKGTISFKKSERVINEAYSGRRYEDVSPGDETGRQPCRQLRHSGVSSAAQECLNG
jgi:hypothetical protein